MNITDRDVLLIVFGVIAVVLIVLAASWIASAVRERTRACVEPVPITDRVGGTMNLILILLGVLGTAFTVTMIVVYCKTGGIPDTLVTCFFAAVFGECGVMGLIRHAKIKSGSSEPKEIKEFEDEEE